MKPKKDNRGGARPGAGHPTLPPEEKKVTVCFQIKSKHKEKAKRKIQPIVDEINKK
jgi:hypothetical protein